MNDNLRPIIVFRDAPQAIGRPISYLDQIEYDYKIESLNADITEIIADNSPVLLIFDISRTDSDCLELCRQIRTDYTGPVLIVSPDNETVDETAAYECGADGYLTKPVEPRLIRAYISNLLRRMSSNNNHNGDARHFISLGSLEVDGLKRRVTIQDREINLTTAEFDLLWLLACHPNEIVTRDQIYKSLRNIEYDGLDRSIDLRIARLRKKIGDTARYPQHIKTVRGTGYLLVSD